MADDIDDLLDEVEESFERAKLRTKDMLTESVKTDDLSDLLDAFEPPPPQPVNIGNNFISSRPQSEDLAKCAIPYLGGAVLPRGMSTGATVRACDKLRCLKCDCRVALFEGFSWTENTDYLFLRNNYPDRLQSRLDPQRGSRAYACQCQHTSVSETQKVDSDKKWVCGKH